MFTQKDSGLLPANEINDHEVNILEFTQCSRISKVEMKGLLMIYLDSLADWSSLQSLHKNGIQWIMAGDTHGSHLLNRL